MRECFSLYIYIHIHKYVQGTRYMHNAHEYVHIFEPFKKLCETFHFPCEGKKNEWNLSTEWLIPYLFCHAITFAHGIRHRIKVTLLHIFLYLFSFCCFTYFMFFFFFFHSKYISWLISYFVRRICVMYSFTLLSRF